MRIPRPIFRVGDQERPNPFFTRVPDTRLLRRHFTPAFVGCSGARDKAAIDWTRRRGVDRCRLPDAYFPGAIETDDVYDATEATPAS